MAPLPFLGVGLNYHREIEPALLDRPDRFDVLEVVTENIRHDPALPEGLRQLMSDKPLVLHGVATSLGAAAPLEPGHLAQTLRTVARWRPVWFSDHIAYSRLGDRDLRQLLPVRRTPANLRRIVDKICRLQEASAVPYLVENITCYFDHADEPIDEADFLNRILHQADCGLLLDLNNLHINGCNHAFDPHEFLDRIDLDRVVEIHLAGGFMHDGLMIDSHGHRIDDAVWALLRAVCKRADPRAVIIERDANFDLEDIFGSIDQARRILGQDRAHDGAASPAAPPVSGGSVPPG